MEFFRFCLEIIRREAERFNVGIQISTASQLTAANVDDFNYDNAHNRCAFLYRCGTINLSFARDCFSKFLLEYNGIQYLLAKWRFDSYLTFCSVSNGPALDYIALLLSHEQCKILTSLIGSIRIITKHGAWRNTANIMLEIINEGYFKNLPPSIGNIEVTQGDPFNNFTEKIRLPVGDSDVVMMIKTLNLQSDGYDQRKISKAIKEFLEALKPGAILFCVDTKPSIKEITQLLPAFSGKYLLEPTNMNTAIDLEYTDLYKGHFGCLPLISRRGCFLVWEKSISSASIKKCELVNELSKSVKYTVNFTDKESDKIITDESKLAFPCKDPLNEKSKNFGQDLSEHFNHCNSSKLGEDNCTANTTFDIGSNDLLLADNANSSYQKSSYPLLCDSSINESVPASNNFKRTSLSSSLNSIKSQLDSISNDVCMQNEVEESLKRIDITKITELTTKITDLTLEVTKILENNPLKCPSNNFTKNLEETFSSSDTDRPCSRFSQCSLNCRTCSYQKCACHQPFLPPNYNSNCASINDETSNCCKYTTAARSNFSFENMTPSTAQLVIPLNSLSSNVVSQIISLITQSNHD